MLILVRKEQQAFWIDNEICIRVLDITPERVKVGITAPRATRIIREELMIGESVAVPLADRQGSSATSPESARDQRSPA